MGEVSFVAVFLGGVLSPLSPCSALLLPAFFAYAFTSKTELFARTLLFLAGLASVFVPLGLGASPVAALLLDYRETTIAAAGWMLIAFGVLELSGVGFSLMPARFAGRFRLGHSAAAIFGVGLVSGLAGFCSGPLLGAVLTVAGASADSALGAALLFTYAVGTTAPLFGIAALWDRFDLGRKGWLRGRGLRLGPVEAHTTNLVAGALMVALGVSFIAFQGGSALSGVYADLGLEELSFWAQVWIADHLSAVSGAGWLVLLVVGAGVVWMVRQGRRAEALPMRRTG